MYFFYFTDFPLPDEFRCLVMQPRMGHYSREDLNGEVPFPPHAAWRPAISPSSLMLNPSMVPKCSKYLGSMIETSGFYSLQYLDSLDCSDVESCRTWICAQLLWGQKAMGDTPTSAMMSPCFLSTSARHVIWKRVGRLNMVSTQSVPRWWNV